MLITVAVDYDGTVMETPGEPAGSLLKKLNKAPTVQEFKGLVFAYGANVEIPISLYDTFDLDGHELVPYH